MDEKFQMLNGETTEEYEIRVCKQCLSDGLTWVEIASIINRETERSHDESTYRKKYKSYLLGLEDGIGKASKVINEDENIHNEIESLIEAKKEKYKSFDERTQLAQYYRALSREETLKEIALNAVSVMSEKKLLRPETIPDFCFSNNSAILQISDWHLGLDFENYWNKYNLEIAKERISKLVSKTIHNCKENNVKDLHVVNLSDLLAGRIHSQIKLQSRIDVIDQTMLASELVCEMLTKFAEHFEVHYYDCLDNHSRLEPNKKESMRLETLSRLITWYVKGRVGDFVQVHENTFGEDIITFNVHGYNVIGVHGDYDKPATVVSKLSCLTHQYYDLCLTAHLHHFSADEQTGTVVISNGSLMGVDSYAADLRLTSKASQNLIIVTDESVVDSIYRIILN